MSGVWTSCPPVSIFYTNDGEFSKLVSHPRAQIEKEYLVETARAIDDDFLNRYAHGIMVGDIVYRCKSYVLRSDHSALITLTEGKNRELRNVFTSRNIRLKRVHRTRIGPLTLRGIAPGHFRRLTEHEVSWFYDHADPKPRVAERHPPEKKDVSRTSTARHKSTTPSKWAKPHASTSPHKPRAAGTRRASHNSAAPRTKRPPRRK